MSGSGWAIRPSPTPTSSRTCTRWTDPDWAGDGKTIHAPCNYQLVLDNLMDLTHEEFVHASSIGQDELSESDFVVTHDDTTVTVTRWMLGIDAPPFWLQEHAGQVPGLRGQGRPLADHPLRGALDDRIDVGVAKAGTGAPRATAARASTAT